MNILAIETTSQLATVAIRDHQGNITEESSTERLSHLQNLMPMIDAVLKKCQLQLGDINCIAVSSGPGSFTGIRIGIATAKALAQFLAIDIVSVPTLNAMAYGYRDYKGIVCPKLDARRGQIYGAAFIWKTENGIKSCMEVVKPGPYMENAFKAQLAEMKLSDEVTFVGEEDQSAINVAKLGFDLYNRGMGTSYYGIKPNYMRLAEAEQKLHEKEKITG